MQQHFEVGEIVRTVPLENGSFTVFVVEGFHLDYVEVSGATGKTEFYLPQQLETYLA